MAIARILLKLLFTLSIIAVASQVVAAEDQQIVIVKSSDNSYFNQTIETLIGQAGETAHFRVINIDSATQSADALDDADLIITMGGKAVRAISTISGDKPVINTYITSRQLEQFPVLLDSHISLLLDQPFERYLAFSQQLIKLKTIGTISRSNPKLNFRQKQLLKKLNLKLDQFQLDETGKSLLTTVRQLVKKNEALLMLPDQTIYNRDTLKGILLTTYRSRTPVISYSPGHVRSGALAAIYSSPTDIGRHLAWLIKQRREGMLKTDNNIFYARYYSIDTNPRVARALELQLTEEQELRRSIDEITR